MGADYDIVAGSLRGNTVGAAGGLDAREPGHPYPRRLAFLLTSPLVQARPVLGARPMRRVAYLSGKSQER